MNTGTKFYTILTCMVYLIVILELYKEKFYKYGNNMVLSKYPYLIKKSSIKISIPKLPKVFIKYTLWKKIFQLVSMPVKELRVNMKTLDTDMEGALYIILSK